MESDVRLVSGWFVQAEPGLAGGKLSVGYGALSPSEQTWLPPIFGAGVKASVMRTWDSSREMPPGETLLGPEFDFTLPYVKLSAGYLWRIGGPEAGRGHFTWGIGAGF
jgi:hypothetical protein